MKLPIGDVPLTGELRRRLEAGGGGGSGARTAIAGLRPEHFEDAGLLASEKHAHGIVFRARIDVLESMGAEYYAYLTVESERVSSRQLEELAQDTGTADLPRAGEGNQVVARLDAASRARQGEEAELWFDGTKLQLFDPESGKNLLGAAESASA
ncbi:MAG: hypothetical protein M3065_15115 [Actinomycetota bacterium]|nr:hypothetical protein [Actinomycetota bacterium]